MAILDTSAIIDLAAQKEKLVELVTKLNTNGDDLLISTISIFELASSKPSGIDPRRKRLLEFFEIVNFTENQAELAGLIYRSLLDRGLDIGEIDCLIAAVALDKQQVLITSNKKHFERIEGLKMESY
jgi:predicted nucleic acid-binding protein